MHDDPLPPGGRALDPEDVYEPQLGSLPEVDPEPGDEAVKTGTTTVAIAVEDAVVIGADRRASLAGRFVSNKDVRKIEQIHPTAALTMVGSVGGAQSFVRNLRVEANLYETRRGEPMSIEALGTLASNFARGGPFFAITPLLGGVDDSGSHVYSIDPTGSLLEDEYTVAGSGTMVAAGTLEDRYEPGLDVDAARDLAADTVRAAAERDTASGNGLTLATVTGDGVEMESFDGYEI